MQKIDLHLFYQESFIDNIIKPIEINLKKKHIILATDGGYLNEQKNRCLVKTEIQIKNWDNLKILEKKTSLTTEISIPKEFLSDIIEFQYNENKLHLVGLGFNSYIEWIFTNPQIEIWGKFDSD